MMSRRDIIWAAAAGAIALAVYVRTLAPGLVATVDTPMFQFIGRVLGVPHNPGYPWYVFVTYVFSFVPVGTLPYRINLFSALLGAVTVALVFLVARRLGCGRVISLAAVLGLAFGPVFWSQAVIAEVYTMYTALVAAMLLALLAWHDTRRSRWFFAALTIFAIGIGHHTTIVAFAPGLAIYALLTDRRFVLRPRTLLIATCILLAGLLPYAFILIRSTMPGVYAESRASTLPELADVILARQFQDRLFAFDWRSIVLQRIPGIARGVLWQEVTTAGAFLAVIGFAWLLLRRTAAGVVLLTGGGAVAAFALVYRVVDTPVFLLPAILVLWIAAAVGAERVVGVVARRRALAAAAALAVLALPASQLTRHFEASDRSRDTRAAAYFDALFEALPDRTALVREDFLVDRLVMFKLLGDDAARGRRIELAPREAAAVRARHDEGVSVFAFHKSTRQLRREGLGFGFRPLPLLGGPLPAHLADLEDGAVVAIAVPSQHAAGLAAAGGASFGEIGGPDALPLDAAAPNAAILGVRGATTGARLQIASSSVHLAVSGGRRIGETAADAPGAIEVKADAGTAAIRQDARDIVSTSEGIAVAIWSRDGRLARTLVLEPVHGYRTPVAPGALAVYPLQGVWPGRRLTTGTSDLTGLLDSGSFVVRAPRGASVVAYLADERPLAPQVVDRSSNEVSVGIASFEGSANALLGDALESDGMSGATLAPAPYAYRIEVNASAGADGAALIAAGGVPRRAVARTAGGNGTAAAVVAVDLAGLLRTPDRASEVLLMTRDEQAQLTGAGWSRVDWDAIGAYRWITAPEARLVLPVTSPASRLRLHAFLDERQGGRAIALRLNHTELPATVLLPGWQIYEWTLPPGSLRIGINDAAVRVDGGVADGAPVRRSGVAVTELRLVR